MKKTLLTLLFTTLISATYVTAQTKTWDFSNTTTWPLGAGIGSNEIVVDGLGLFPIATNTNFGAVNASSATFSDAFVGVNRFQMNGGGGAVAPVYLPVQRYVYFTVNGACTVKVWFKTGSNTSTRTIFCTNGTTLLGSASSNDSATGGTNADTVILTTTISAAAAAVGKIYIYGDQSNNLYKIEVTGATVNTPALGLNNFQSDSVNVFSNGKQINVFNVISETQVNVYSMTGALVKSFATSSDANFELLNSGLYIVNVKSAEGQKSVKVLVK
jgi:hypothetical protein